MDPSAPLLMPVIDKAREALWALEEAVAAGNWTEAAEAAADIQAGMSVLEQGFRAVDDMVDAISWSDVAT